MALIMVDQLKKTSVGQGRDINVNVDFNEIKNNIKAALEQATSNSSLMLEAYNKVTPQGSKNSKTIGGDVSLVANTGKNLGQKVANSFTNIGMATSFGGAIGKKSHYYENFAINLTLRDNNGKLTVDNEAVFGMKTDKREAIKGRFNIGLPFVAVETGKETRTNTFNSFNNQPKVKLQFENNSEIQLQDVVVNQPLDKYKNIENVDDFLKECKTTNELVAAYNNIPSLQNKYPNPDDFFNAHSDLFNNLPDEHVVPVPKVDNPLI
jgi:hypothetical protein